MLKIMNKIDNCLIWMEKSEQSNSFRRIVLITAIGLQILVMAFFAGQKSNYYIDEMFSMGYAHTYIHPKEDVVYINFSKDWENEKWIDNEILKSQLETTKEDSVFTLPLPQALRRLFLRRNFMGILNVLMSTFAPGKMTAYPAIAFNIVIFILTQLLLYRICRELGSGFAASLMAIVMYGFSAIAIGLTLYIRFYAWVIFLLIALVRIHQKMWGEGKLWKCEIWTVISLVLIYLALKNSELVFIFAGALIGLYALGLLLSRQWKKAIAYMGTVVPLSLFYAVTKTSFVDMILHPANYTEFEGPMGWMTRDMLSMSIEKFRYFVRLYKRWVDEQLVGSKFVTYAFLIIFLLLLEMRLLGRKPDKPAKNAVNEKNSPGTGAFSDASNSVGVLQTGRATSFIWVILVVELVYLTFCFLTCLPATRYVSFLFPFIPVLLWTGISRLAEDQKYRSLIMTGCAVLTGIGIVSGLMHSDRIEYVYMEDRPLIASLEKEGIRDAIVIYTDEEDATHVVYDCVNLMPDEAKICPVQETHHKIDTDESQNEILIWIKNGESIHPCTDDLIISGHQIDWLGRTHASDVYVAHRTN